MGWVGADVHDISIHAPVKGATIYLTKALSMLEISIHAPVKGATKNNNFYFEHVTISIHAPVKGATSLGSRLGRAGCNFNPRSREGSDVFVAACICASQVISIHAPVKGATGIARPGGRVAIISIHAPVKGATWTRASLPSWTVFQSTLP